jgi:hypothetical protein
MLSVGPPPNPNQVAFLKEEIVVSLVEATHEKLQRQLAPNEQLIAGVLTYILPSFGLHFFIGPLAGLLTRQALLGATENDLVLLEMNFLGKFNEQKRFPLSQLKTLIFKQGFLTDKLKIDTGDAKALTFSVPYWVREETKKIADQFGAVSLLPH